MLERTDAQIRRLHVGVGLGGLILLLCLMIETCGPCRWWDDDPVSEVPKRCLEPSLKDWRGQ